MKTLYVSDLDGTLLNADAEISGDSLIKLNEMILGGLCFSAATARTPVSASQILSRLEPSYPDIYMNGAIIFDRKTGEYKKIYGIAPKTVAAIIDSLAAAGITPLMYDMPAGGMRTYHGEINDANTEAFIGHRKIKYKQTFIRTDDLKTAPAENIVYFTVLGEKERVDEAKKTIENLSGINIVLYRDVYSMTFDEHGGVKSALWIMEVCAGEASKKNAALYLKGLYGFDRMVCFGDNLNDLPLFEACDTRVAVANAHPEVLAAADIVVGSNEDGGVVKWICENFNKIG